MTPFHLSSMVPCSAQRHCALLHGSLPLLFHLLVSHPQIQRSPVSLYLRLCFWGNPGEDKQLPPLTLLLPSWVFVFFTSVLLLPQRQSRCPEAA